MENCTPTHEEGPFREDGRQNQHGRQAEQHVHEVGGPAAEGPVLELRRVFRAGWEQQV